MPKLSLKSKYFMQLQGDREREREREQKKKIVKDNVQN